MTTKELLIACGSGVMPKVKNEVFGIGQVTTIKDNDRYIGCAVKFESPNYDIWFWDSNETDKRTKYMRELSLL